MAATEGSDVHFADFRIGGGDTALGRLRRLVDAAGLGRIDMDGKTVALKVHFGERGNMAHLRPGFCRAVADAVRDAGGVPFLTDCSTLYAGRRRNAVEHLEQAASNGFGYESTGCRVIIADGLRGDDDAEVPVEGCGIGTALIGRAIRDADVLVTVSHFKCHELAGIGGAVKNLGMGCASRRGKMAQHSEGKPSVDPALCRGCGSCAAACGSGAASVSDGRASIDPELCTGCGMCIARCRFDAISAPLDRSNASLGERMAEYALAAVSGKPNFHVSLVMDVSPLCDCHSDNGLPIVPNIGMLASFDPVALDAACADLVNAAPKVPGSLAEGCAGSDVFKYLHSKTDWRATLEHAQEIGLGTVAYRLVRVR